MSDPKPRFSKSRLLQQGVKFEDWQAPDLRALPEEQRGKVQNRVSALKAFFLQGASCGEIENRYGVAKSSLYLMIEKALQPDDEGEYIGYRAAILQFRVKPNERHIELTDEGDQRPEFGDAGVFSQLLQRYPELDRLMRRYASLYKPRKEGGPDDLWTCTVVF